MMTAIKKIASYLYPVNIETILDKNQHPISLDWYNGRLRLSANHAIYSLDDLYINFYKPLKTLVNPFDVNKNVLILGFGLGSIIYIMEKKLKCSFSYTGVELDPAVIYLSSKYSLPRFKSSINIIQDDAAIFPYYCDDLFDIICVDVFDDDKIPYNLQSSEWLLQLNQLLNPEGFILFNRLNQSYEDKKDTELYENNIFSTVFNDYRSFIVKGNKILMGTKRI